VATLVQVFKQKNENAKIHFLVKMELDGITLRYTNSDTAIAASSDELYIPGILNEIKVKTVFNLSQFRYSIGAVMLKLSNDARLQDYERDSELDGGTVTIYLFAEGADFSDVESNGVLFVGAFNKRYHNTKEYVVDCIEKIKYLDRIPDKNINSDTYSNHRTDSDGQGSVAGLPQPYVFGKWLDSKVALLPVDTSGYKYLVSKGYVSSTNADYTAGTVDVYEKDGDVRDPANYDMEITTDGEGSVCTLFDFTTDHTDLEPLSATIDGIVGEDLSGTSSQLLTHPAEIAKYLIDEHSPIDADNASLATAVALRKGFKFSTCINSKAELVDVLDRLFRQCFCARRVQPNGKLGCITFNTDGPVNKYVNLNNVAIGEVKIEKTDFDLVTNDIELNYAYDFVTRKFNKTKVFNRHNNDTCNDSYQKYGSRPQKEINLQDIQDEGSVEAYVIQYLNVFAFRHDLISTTIPFYIAHNISEFDVINVTTKEGISVEGSTRGWVDISCIVLSREVHKRGIKLKLWKISTAADAGDDEETSVTAAAASFWIDDDYVDWLDEDDGIIDWVD